MKLKSALAFSLLLAGTNSVAEEEEYKALCIEEKSTGFNWINGGWKQVNFENEKYIVTKLKIYTDKSKNPTGCKHIAPKSINPDPLARIFSGLKGESGECINIRDFGEEYSEVFNRTCEEHQVKDDSSRNGYLTIAIDCKAFGQNFIFDPDGKFHRTKIHTNLSTDPINDYKDSLVISVGTCTKL